MSQLKDALTLALLGMLLMPLPCPLRAAEFTATSTRAPTTELFDFDWRVFRGKVSGAKAADFDDAEWRQVDLPHDFAIHEPFDEKAPDGK